MYFYINNNQVEIVPSEYDIVYNFRNGLYIYKLII